jgi:L-arabinokinase
MFRITHGSTHGLHDIEAFVRGLNTLPEACRLFRQDAPITVARAPGRLDVMGGIADYSGSLVLQLPLTEAACVALQPADDRVIRIVSLGAEGNDRSPGFEMTLDDLAPNGNPLGYAAARRYFRRDPQTAWSAYVAGAFLVLMRELRAPLHRGARILIDSAVPEGKGVSSSAALEVASMQAVAAAFDLALEPRELAILCQKVENLIVGAPCGVMDQMTAACGEPDRLMALLCQPAELQGSVRIPDSLRVWGLDSGVRHAVSGSDYTSVRVGAFMGYRIVADLAGLSASPPGSDGVVDITDTRWNGYLANVPPSVFEQSYAARIPERMAGSDFLSRYGGSSDAVTRVDPGLEYAVRVPARHPIHEHFRVRSFARLLRPNGEQPDAGLLGELMYQSHASYSACGLGSEGTDLLVGLVRESGPGSGLHGAKITGGGSGGTVAVLGNADAGPAIADIAARYAERTGHQPYVFSGSSIGAPAFGHLVLAWQKAA